MPSKRNAARKSPSRRAPLVGVLMGSTSDWETMRHAAETLEALGIPYEKRVISAHRTPKLMIEFATRAAGRGFRALILGAGGAAHVAGMTAALTTVPVLGVPIESQSLKGLDSLFSIVQMPGGIPVATFAIGKPGAVNAALFAAAIIAHGDPAVSRALRAYRSAQTRKVLRARLP